jgi:hypothetical protein
MVPIRPDTPHVMEWIFDIHPLLGKWETLVGEGVFSWGMEGTWTWWVERRDEFQGLSCDFEEGGENGVFCEARCGLSGVRGERERDH